MTQPSLSLVDTDPAELAVDAIVIGVHSQPDDAAAPCCPPAGAESIAAAFDGKLTATLALLGATGAPGEVTKLATLGTVTAPVVVAVGLGAEPTGAAPATGDAAPGAPAPRSARWPAARRSRWRCRCPTTRTRPAVLRAVAEGALLGAYRFAGYKTKPQPGRRDPVAGGAGARAGRRRRGRARPR